MEDDIYERLLDRLRGMKTAAVGFSGGADSTFLLMAAKAALGDKVLALTAVTPYMERQEVADALALGTRLRVRHELVELEMPEGVEGNPPDRCYICKRALFGRLLEVAQNAGFGRVLEGSNLDDLGDFRPGMRALRELEIDSPLLACKISKADVHRLSESLGLSTWNKPTNACLLTRLPIGQRVTMEDLNRLEEAERFLRSRGFVCVRVRMHADLARIEVTPEQRRRLLEEAKVIVKTLQRLGFRHVTLDLLGYRFGSMDPLGAGCDRVAADAASESGGERRDQPQQAGVKVGPS